TRRRRRAGRTDADQLAMLTGVPGGLWVAVFGTVALGALAVGTLWLVQ
ncbi:MAG TPA: M50 family metallopeptidase, partial [Streptosporangiaceae bacterium]